MSGWLKKTFGKKEQQDSPAGQSSSAAPSPSAGTSQSSRSKRQSSTSSSSRKSATNGRRPSSTPAPPPRRPPTSNRVSSHDLTMAAATMGLAPPPGPASRSQSYGELRPDLQQQQMDADLAMAYSLAAQEQGAPPQQFAPPPPLPVPPPNAMPSPSPFGEAVSLPPPAAGTRPDLAMAAALAESQYAARQAAELARTTEAVYQAAVDKALEVSMQTVNYDNLLRDIKIWIIDLAACTDEVLAALDDIVKMRALVAEKLERALEADDERRIRKLTWQAENLPAAEDRLRDLADKMTPVGLAVVELQDLRDHVLATSPPVARAEKERDEIIAKMIKAMSRAGLQAPQRRSENGPGSSKAPLAASSGPADLRDLVSSYIYDAQRLPKMPRSKSSASNTTATASVADPTEDFKEAIADSAASVSSVATSSAVPQDALREASSKSLLATPKTTEEEIQPVDDVQEEEETFVDVLETQSSTKDCALLPVTPASEPIAPLSASSLLEDQPVQDQHINGTIDEDMSTMAKKKASLWRRLSTRHAADAAATPSTPGTAGGSAASSVPSATSAGTATSTKRTNTTTPIPFQLSSSRWKAKGPAGSPVQVDSLRRVPALISLHYELRKTTGVVAEAVGWTEGPSFKAEAGPAAAVPAPSKAATKTFGSPESMVNFVRENGGFPSITPCKFDANDRWSVMCAAAGMYEALNAGGRELTNWEVPSGASAAAECHRVVDTIARTAALLGHVTHVHDPLRQAMTKNNLPWDDALAIQVRWAAQTAALAAINHSLQTAEESGKVKGPWQRQVLKPLGHGVMAAFAVHQLAGGFSIETAAACDILVERTVHHARMIDPKWFRGHKVVS